jgi:hypothetical protein
MPSKSIVNLLLAFGVIGLGGPLAFERLNRLGSAAATRHIVDSSQSAEAPSPASNFQVQKLAEGVYAVIRKEPPGLMVDANRLCREAKPWNRPEKA